MSLKLEKVVPWGRSFAEYVRMFDLSATDLQRNILDCAGGPASFNAEMTQQGYRATSCDPIYQFSIEAIEQRIEEAYPLVIKAVEANAKGFVWRDIASLTELGQIRMAAMRQFLADFSQGQKAGRYLTHALPDLPFAASQFDLALCSHFLFTYSDQLSLSFHLESIAELCRVAAEVRIFPLLVNMSGELSSFLQPTIAAFELQGYDVQIRLAPYEFQRGGNQLLQIKRFASSEGI